ncbi:MAG: hypothetical protein HAW67_03260 [Endozoicomonadaceae bacterium]|nr:hypothetical protein [Endozoicomonadaceae bacterium]
MKFFLKVLIVGILCPFAQATNFVYEKACIDDVCFVKIKNTAVEQDIKTQYNRLINTLDKNPLRLFDLSDEFKHQFKDPNATFIRNFGWLIADSLRYIIVGEKYSALLLNKSDTDRYALLFDNVSHKFFVRNEWPQELRVIDKLWINGSGRLTVVEQIE